jgi:hypothetical protein
MVQYVDIEGAGELATKITQVGSASPSTGTVLGISNAELRSLTVENTGGNTYAVAIFNQNDAPLLTHVTAVASGGNSNYGVYNTATSSPTMTNVTASASGGTNNSYAIANVSLSSPTMQDLSDRSETSNYNYGV